MSVLSPLVSVCVTVYNKAPFIERCLDSVLREGYPNIELVVIDDGSTDGSDAALARWFAAHPEISARRERTANRGVSAAWNAAFRLARGAYFVILDGDDALAPGGIRGRVDYLARRPDKLAVFGDASIINEEGRVLYPSAYRGFRWVSKRALLSDRWLKYQMAIRWCVPGSLMLIDRRLYERIGGYDETLRCAVDFDFFLRALAIGAVGFLDQPVALHRLSAASLTSSDAGRIRVLRNFRPIVRKNAPAFGWAVRACLTVIAWAAWAKAGWMDRTRGLSPTAPESVAS